MAAEEHSEKPDMFNHIFELQEELNDYVFSNNGITGPGNKPLEMTDIAASAVKGQLSVNELPNQWIVRYARAMEGELEELSEDLLWKWWSKDTLDIQNVRVELVDILHFLVSAMIAAGLTPEGVHELYEQKHKINVQRQDSGYSKATKTEADNKTVK